MNKIIEKKTNLIKELNDFRNKYIKADVKYRRKKCRIMLECNFEELLNKSRPTVAEKEAYVELKTLNLKEKRDLIKNSIRNLENEIEICNDILMIEVEK